MKTLHDTRQEIPLKLTYWYFIGGELDIYLNCLYASLHGLSEGQHCVLRGVQGSSPVCDLPSKQSLQQGGQSGGTGRGVEPQGDAREEGQEESAKSVQDDQ